MEKNNNLCNFIKNYKNGDESAILNILDKMKPLINSYAKKIYWEEYEDMQQELSLVLIKSIQNMKDYNNEYACLAYVKRSVHLRFLEQWQKHHKQKNFIFVPYDSTLATSLPISMSENNTVEIQLFLKTIFIPNHVTLYKIALGMIIDNKSDTEIANELHLSRQYINRIRKKITKLLKSALQ